MQTTDLEQFEAEQGRRTVRGQTPKRKSDLQSRESISPVVAARRDAGASSYEDSDDDHSSEDEGDSPLLSAAPRSVMTDAEKKELEENPIVIFVRELQKVVTGDDNISEIIKLAKIHALRFSQKTAAVGKVSQDKVMAAVGGYSDSLESVDASGGVVAARSKVPDVSKVRVNYLYSDQDVLLLRDALLSANGMKVSHDTNLVQSIGVTAAGAPAGSTQETQDGYKTFMLPPISLVDREVNVLQGLRDNLEAINEQGGKKQILIPVRKGINHWVVVQVLPDAGVFYCHDPLGDGEVEDEISGAISEVFSGFNEEKSLVKKIQGTITGDYVYCGGYVTHLMHSLASRTAIIQEGETAQVQWQCLQANNLDQRQDDVLIVNQNTNIALANRFLSNYISNRRLADMAKKTDAIEVAQMTDIMLEIDTQICLLSGAGDIDVAKRKEAVESLIKPLLPLMEINAHGLDDMESAEVTGCLRKAYQESQVVVTNPTLSGINPLSLLMNDDGSGINTKISLNNLLMVAQHFVKFVAQEFEIELPERSSASASYDSDTQTEYSDSDNDEEDRVTKGVLARSIADNKGGVEVTAVRPRTLIGPQCEHASAYLLFEQLIYEMVEGVKPSDVPKRLAESFSCLPLSKTAIKELQDVVEEAKEAVADFTDGKGRWAVERTLEGANIILENADTIYGLVDEGVRSSLITPDKAKDIQKALRKISKTDDTHAVRVDIKKGVKFDLSGFVTRLMDICVNGSNKMANVSFPSDGVAPNPNTGKEQVSKNALRALSIFLNKMKDGVKDPGKRAEVLADGALVESMEKHWGITIETIQNMKSINEVEKLVKKGVVEKMSQLFYYPKVDPKEMDKCKRVWPALCKAKGYNKGTNPRDNNPGTLYDVASRHVVLTMNCFSGLQNLSSKFQDDIIGEFAKKVVTTQGWNRGLAPITAAKLGSEIRKCATIDCTGKRFYAQGSEKHDEEKAKGAIVKGKGGRST